MNIAENANNDPVTAPIAAECVEIFHHIFITAQTSCITNATISMLLMKCGNCRRFMI